MLIRPTALLAALMLASYAPPAAAEEKPVKVGVMLCLTGDCAEWGTNGLKGVQLGAEELNSGRKVLGRSVELVVQDSKDTVPASSVSAFQNLLLDPDLHFIIGPTWTVGGMPLAPLAAKRPDVILISPSVGVRDFNETSANIFNTWPHDEIATRALAAYAAKNGWKKAAVFGSQDPFYVTQSRIFEEEFGRMGGAVAEKVEPLPDSKELKMEALRVKRSSPEFAVMTNYQADFIAKELRRIGFTAPLLAVQMEKARVAAADGALEGVVFAMYENPREDFTKNFRKKFGTDPGISADTSYDALMLYAEGIKRAEGTDPEKVRAELQRFKDFRGASGTFSFDEKGAVDKKPVLWRVKGLDFERVP